MRGGRLRKRLDIQSYDDSQLDAHGNPIKRWTTNATRWGSIEPASGREVEIANMQATRVTHRVTIRYYKGLNTKMRIRYAPPAETTERIFHIQSILTPDERRIQMNLMCVEGIPDA